jgi:hypothetical protein
MDLHRLEDKVNRFRARRKAKEQQAETSFDFDTPSGLLFGSKSFGKNKKPIPEIKPTINLATALPSSNDFRTSLIMPNLSARFSMLREQDDPSTKIGKANDDSVLFPKRASRLNLFSHNPLTDIAEVDSIRESIRPPFAYGERKHSLDGDGYDSDGGASIMGRSRPGEGNTLFGGRQKLYKIPAESSSKSPLNPESSEPEPAGMSGRVMYENDVSLSLFQKHRQKERHDKGELEERDSLGDAEDETPHSPATSFSKDRGTASSTTSGPRRNSTAATSIDSQSPGLIYHNGSTSSLSSPKAAIHPKPEVDRNNTVYRKIYGQALQQSSSIQRVAKDVFDNLGRPRADSNDKKVNIPSPIRNNSNLNESSSPTLLSNPSSNFRSANPLPSILPSGATTLDSRLRDAKPLEVTQSQMHGYARPLSPPASDGEEAVTLVNSVQPEDRGKATALGLFNKPSRQYDEQQFSQRQLQMHQGRNSPIPQRASPTPASTPASPGETVATIKTDDDSKQGSKMTKDAQAPAVSLIRRQNEELATLEAQRMASSQQPETRPISSQVADTPETFLDGDDEPSPKEDEAATSIPSHETSNDTHPAFRPVMEEFKFGPWDHSPATAKSEAHRPFTSVDDDDHHGETLASDDFDPSLERIGLSGLIRTHLRNDSDKSSIYPPVSPRITPTFANDSPKLGAPPPNTHNLDRQKQTLLTDAQFRMAQNAKQFLSNANLLKNQSKGPTQRLPDEDTGGSRRVPENFPTWHDELQPKHQRGASTETQYEREAFNNELAERRRKVQETLKNVVESNSRSASPVLGSEPSLSKPGGGLSARLRSKSSRSKPGNIPFNPPNAPDHSVKAMKLLGMGGGSSPNIGSLERPQEQLWKEEEERMLQDFSRRSKPKHTFGPSPTRTFPRAPPEPWGSRTTQSEDTERPRQRSVTPASIRNLARDRSASDVSGRSKSRNGQRRHDLDKAIAEGPGSRGRAYELSNASNISIAPHPSIEVGDQPERSASSMSGRYRSNSRSNTPGYFDSKPLKPIQTSGMSSTSLSNRPSPKTPYSANSTPPIFETSSAAPHSSVVSFAQPTDGRTTPSLRDRKRSITKNMISDPTFVSTTYAVATVDLPPGASLRNGSPENYPKAPSSPAIPFINPARRRGRVGTSTSTTHTLLSTLTGRANDSKANLGGPLSARPALPLEERSNFSDEGDDKRSAPFRPRQKLRKVSSEGGDMNAKARYQALMAGPSPALPTFPVKRGPSPTMQRVEGGMF